MMFKPTSHSLIIAYLMAVVLLCGCGGSAYGNQTSGSKSPEASVSAQSAASDQASETSPEASVDVSGDTSGDVSKESSSVSDSQPEGEADGSAVSEPTGGTRDNTPVCLVPEAPGTEVYENDLATIDASNSSEGYIMVCYLGTCPKVKMQITCPNTVTYTYRLSNNYEVFPLTKDSGLYRISIFENISGTQYSTAFSTDLNVTITNELGPYLYPNQYVNFTADSASVAKGVDLASTANNDLEVVSNVYNYIITHVTYDTAKASSVQSGYLPDPDQTLADRAGICLDYASLMASMLRSQRIPTHMEVGYAGTAYHAWISTYISDIGWINGIIEFDGSNWELMDPTLASNYDAAELQDFIGDGSNYETKYIY